MEQVKLTSLSVLVANLQLFCGVLCSDNLNGKSNKEVMESNVTFHSRTNKMIIFINSSH